jgi:hypothetical protein
VLEGGAEAGVIMFSLHASPIHPVVTELFGGLGVALTVCDGLLLVLEDVTDDCFPITIDGLEPGDLTTGVSFVSVLCALFHSSQLLENERPRSADRRHD